MKLSLLLQESWRSLTFSKLRSFLALLGVLVGTASVVAMVSGGELATQEALKQFKSLGTDLLALSINNANTGSNTTIPENLSLPEALALSKQSAEIKDIAPYTQIFYPLSYHGHLLNSTILGTTSGFARVVHIHIQEGRFISELDHYTFYCVIGQKLYQAMKKISYNNPIGQQLQIGNTMCTIIGVAEAWPENSFVYADINNAVILPLLASTLISKYAVINNIIFQLKSGAAIPEVEHKITQYIQQIAKKELFFQSAQELIAKMKAQSQIFTVFLGLIGGIALIVGGIGVMNMMLVSVIERRREIGIRLAIGAKRRDIAMLFLCEAGVLSFAGGILGVLLGLIVTYLAAMIWHWTFTLLVFPAMIGIMVSISIGLFFGSYPAYRASCCNPIQALRAEQ